MATSSALPAWTELRSPPSTSRRIKPGRPPANASLRAKSETKSIEIKGQECSFAIKRGEDPISKKKMCQIVGVIPGKRGPAFFSLEMDEKAFKEDAIVKMLEAIK